MNKDKQITQTDSIALKENITRRYDATILNKLKGMGRLESSNMFYTQNIYVHQQ